MLIADAFQSRVLRDEAGKQVALRCRKTEANPAMLSCAESASVSVHDAQFVVRKRYSDLQPLAGGAYGLVATAADTGPDGIVKRVAIKKMPRAFKRHAAHTTRSRAT